MKSISLLGSTGSIGTQTLDVIREHAEKLSIRAIYGHSNIDLLHQQIIEFQPDIAGIKDADLADQLREKSGRTEIVYGERGLKEIATFSESDTLVSSLVGFAGVQPTLDAIEAGKDIGLANKETLVAAGHLIMPAVKKAGITLMPIDSEHSALFQSLQGNRREDVKKMILTCSGGSFRFKKRDDLMGVTKDQALNHPTWKMGGKITIDSATLFNKGLEVIEAHWLYDLPYDQIETVMHPQSIIHSFVEYVDGNLIAQVGTHDMRLPIQYALSFPERWGNEFPKLSLEQVQKMEFFPIDHETFPGITMARQAGNAGGSLPTVLNAANEEAVYAFLAGKIEFLQIYDLVGLALTKHKLVKNPDLETVLKVDKDTREMVQTQISHLKS